MKRIKKAESKGNVLCCNYCADSKFPCVKMENQMKKEQKTEKENK